MPSIKLSFNEWFIERVENRTGLVGRFSLRRFKHPPASAVGGVKSHTIGSATILPTVEPGEIRLNTRERQAVVLTQHVVSVSKFIHSFRPNALTFVVLVEGQPPVDAVEVELFDCAHLSTSVSGTDRVTGVRVFN